MKVRNFLACFLFILCLFPFAQAQQVDAAFGMNALSSPAASDATGNYFPQAMRGGFYPSVSANVLLRRSFGFNGEVAWRASQNLYQGYQPYRSIFFDFNGVFAPSLGRHAGAELMAGIGAADHRFYQGFYTCNFTSCTNYISSTHFMGHVGGGLKLYVKGNVFVRPEAHLYLIRNNLEFSSGYATRYGVSLGYTFGGNR